MATRLSGITAIQYAEENGLLLSAHARGSEPEKYDLTVDEARLLALEDPARIYIDFDEISTGGSRLC